MLNLSSAWNTLDFGRENSTCVGWSLVSKYIMQIIDKICDMCRSWVTSLGDKKMTLQTELLYAQLTYADHALPALNSATQNMGVNTALVTHRLDEAEIQHCICSCWAPVFALNCLQKFKREYFIPNTTLQCHQKRWRSTEYQRQTKDGCQFGAPGARIWRRDSKLK